jgi:hypothetical protein
MKQTNETSIRSAMTSITDFMIELKEKNDRATVIVGAANIDGLLGTLIAKSLLPPMNVKRDELLDGDSALSTFSSKIHLCYRLALIDRDLCQSLHILRRIRNDFAHQIKGCDLNSPPHSDQVQQLVSNLHNGPLLAKLRLERDFVGDHPNSRDFRIILSLISALLEIKIRNVPSSVVANPASMAWLPEEVDVAAKNA